MANFIEKGRIPLHFGVEAPDFSFPTVSRLSEISGLLRGGRVHRGLFFLLFRPIRVDRCVIRTVSDVGRRRVGTANQGDKKAQEHSVSKMIFHYMTHKRGKVIELRAKMLQKDSSPRPLPE